MQGEKRQRGRTEKQREAGKERVRIEKREICLLHNTISNQSLLKNQDCRHLCIGWEWVIQSLPAQQNRLLFEGRDLPLSPCMSHCSGACFIPIRFWQRHIFLLPLCIRSDGMIQPLPVQHGLISSKKTPLHQPLSWAFRELDTLILSHSQSKPFWGMKGGCKEFSPI